MSFFFIVQNFFLRAFALSLSFSLFLSLLKNTLISPPPHSPRNISTRYIMYAGFEYAFMSCLALRSSEPWLPKVTSRMQPVLVFCVDFFVLLSREFFFSSAFSPSVANSSPLLSFSPHSHP